MATGIVFEKEFETFLTNKGRVRGNSLKKVPIGQIFNNTTERKGITKLLTKLGLQDYTIEDIFGKKQREFVETLVNSDKLTAGKKNDIIGPFKPLLAEVGISAQGTANPLRSLMTAVVGDGVMKAKGFDTTTKRAIPANYPMGAYQAFKNLASKYNSQGKHLEKSFLLMLMMGGYRPSDFKNISFENINFETGLVKDVNLKTTKAGDVKLAYLPEAQRDILTSLMKKTGNKTGLVFPNYKELTDTINEDLSKTNIRIEFLTEAKNDFEQRPLHLYDTRRIKESDLTAAGIDNENFVRKLYTWRPKKGNVEQYQAGLKVAGQIEDFNAKSFSPYVLLTEGNLTGDGKKTIAQFLEDVGVETTEYTKQYLTTKKSFKSLPPFQQKQVIKLFPNIAYPNEVDGMAIADPENFQEVSKENAQLNQQKTSFKLQQEIAKEGSAALEQKAQFLEDLKKYSGLDQAIADEKDRIAQETKTSKLKKAIEKGNEYLDWATKNLKSIVAGTFTTLGGIGYALEAKSDFLKYKQRGFSDVGAGVGAGMETIGDVAVDTAVGMNVPRLSTQLALSLISPAGEGTDVVRETGRTQAGQQIPQRQIGMESESANFLNQMQSNLQSEGIPEAQALDIIEQDTNIGNKMSTFGRTPDVSPGFVTPPSKSDLADETQRQQNFMGVT